MRAREAGIVIGEGTPGPNNAMLAINTGLRPMRSLSGPEINAPAMMPMFDHKNAIAKAGGARCQTWVKDGTDQPIEPTS